MNPGDMALVTPRGDKLAWRVDEILPGGQVNLSREPDPFEQVWTGYKSWTMPAGLALDEGTRLHCQVQSVEHLKPISPKEGQ